jgi:hypothetical protein
MWRTVESCSHARAPHGHGIREHNPAAGAATLSAMAPREQHDPVPRWQGEACRRGKDSLTCFWGGAIAPCVTHGRLTCLGSLVVAQN